MEHMKQAVWTKVPERGTFRMMRLGMVLLNFFGYRIGKAVGMLVCGYFYLTGSSSRSASAGYLKRLHAFAPTKKTEPTARNVLNHHWHFAINLIDRLWFWQGRMKNFHFTREGREHIRNRKSGILLLGAHLGSFDALRAFSQDKHMKLNVVMYRAHADKINHLLQSLNAEADLQVVELDKGGVDQIFALKERIDAGEVVAILADRPAPHGRNRTTEIPFLGCPAAFPQNPWILASLLECPVFFTVGLRIAPRHYHVIVEPMFDQVILPRNTRQESLRVYMERYVKRLEELCCEHPYQWFNYFNFWKQRPSEADES